MNEQGANAVLFDREHDHPNCKNSQILAAVTKRIANVVSSIRAKDRFALTIGGDHSCGLGTVAGVLVASLQL